MNSRPSYSYTNLYFRFNKLKKICVNFAVGIIYMTGNFW